MKKTALGFLSGFFVAACLFAAGWYLAQDRIPLPPGHEVYFSPRGGCTAAIIEQINDAKSEILIQAYSFTSKPISTALIDARRRGVHVVAVIDSDQYGSKYTVADDISDAGCEVWFDKKHAISHNKILVIDGKTIVTGSFNFTKAAEESNSENLLIISDSDGLVHRYVANFNEHRNHAIRYSEMENKRSQP